MIRRERNLLDLACVFSLVVTVVTVILVAADVIDTIRPIWLGMGVVIGAYIGHQSRTPRPDRSPTSGAIDRIRRDGLGDR